MFVRHKQTRRVKVTHLAAIALLLAATACNRDNVRKGDAYAAAGKNAEAVLEYRNAVQRDPRNGVAREKLGALLLANGDVAGAFGEYVRAADLRPDDRDVQLKAGNLLLLAGRFDDAKACAEKVLARNASDVDGQILMANALGGLRDVDGAVAQIEDALKADPNRAGTYSNLGALELARGQRDAAETAFEKAVALAPKSVAAQQALANFYWLTGRHADAEAALNRALELDPRDALTNRALANFYLATDRRESAEKPLRTVYEVAKTPAAGFALAEYYTAVGKDPAARDLLASMLTDRRVAGAAAAQIAALDYKSGHREEAFRRLAGVLAADPSQLQALMLKGVFLSGEGKLDEALATVTAATERHPDSTPAFFLLGRVQAARRQTDAAMAAFNEVLRLNPRATEAKVALANLHLSQGRPDTSMNFAQEALANEPSNAGAQLALVRSLLARGELDRAARELKGLAARFPNSSAVHTHLGTLFVRKRDYAAAKVEFERAAALDPDGLEPLAGLVAVDLAARNYTSARARVDARLTGAPGAPLLALAARVYGASGDVATEEQLLRRAILTDSGYLQAYGELGQLYLHQRKLDAAKAEFETLAERSPKSVGPLTMVGMLLQAEGDVAGAQKRFERALQIDPESAVAANNLAWIYAQNGGNLDVAMQLARTAQQHLPGAAEVNDTLGFIYYKKNLASLAVSTLKVSAEKDPGNAVYQYHLGLAYAGSGDTARAKESFTRALKLKSDFSGADDARSFLASAAR